MMFSDRAVSGIITDCSHALRIVGSIRRKLSFICESRKTLKYLYSYSEKKISTSSTASHQ